MGDPIVTCIINQCYQQQSTYFFSISWVRTPPFGVMVTCKYIYTEILVCPSGASLLANTSSSVWAGNGDGCGYLGDLAVKYFVLSLWLRLLAHMHDATQLFLHTCTMLRNCTCTHARCYATVLAHMHHATQFYLHTCTMLRNYTRTHARCYANLLAHMLVATQIYLHTCSLLRNCACTKSLFFSIKHANLFHCFPKDKVVATLGRLCRNTGNAACVSLA